MPDVGHTLSEVGGIALVWVPIVMFGLIIYLLWRTLQVMPRVKTTHVEASKKSSVSWKNVAGLEEAREEMQEIVDFLRDSKRFAKLGARVPKGILLYGPPGTGKTLLAKAVAHASNANFYSQSASAFVEMFAGLGAARIRKLFDKARKNEPARVVAGLQQRRVVTEKEKRILAYHEAGHALMSRLVGDPQPVQKVTIVSRGRALGYTLNTPQEDRYLHTKEELLDLMKVLLGGRAAEQIVFGAVTNGAANDLERVTELARSMIFEFGMGEEVSSRTMRADNYALSEHTKRVRDQEQSRLTDHAFAESLRLLTKHRSSLDLLANALLEKETLMRSELEQLLAGVAPESDASAKVGTPRIVQLPDRD